MAYSCVKVIFEIGHEASIRNKRTPDGFTHDWEVFVRGADNTDIHYFIEKVVFHLHETFVKPKRAVKDPPYVVKESGYAGFTLPIDIYLRGKDEPRKIKFQYDLTLQSSGPRISNLIREKYIFTNPSEDFRRKLIKGGGKTSEGGAVSKRAPTNETSNILNALDETTNIEILDTIDSDSAVLRRAPAEQPSSSSSTSSDGAHFIIDVVPKTPDRDEEEEDVDGDLAIIDAIESETSNETPSPETANEIPSPETSNETPRSQTGRKRKATTQTRAEAVSLEIQAQVARGNLRNEHEKELHKLRIKEQEVRLEIANIDRMRAEANRRHEEELQTLERNFLTAKYKLVLEKGK